MRRILSYRDILDYSHLIESVLKEVVSNKIDKLSKDGIEEIINKPDFKGMKIIFKRPLPTNYMWVTDADLALLAPSSRRKGSFQLTFFQQENDIPRPINHITLSPELEPEFDDVYTHDFEEEVINYQNKTLGYFLYDMENGKCEITLK
jgi:hypothetical protein